MAHPTAPTERAGAAYAAQGRSCAIAVAVAPLPRRCRCAVAFGAPVVAPRVDYRNIQVPDPAPLPLRRCVWRADGFSRSRLPEYSGPGSRAAAVAPLPLARLWILPE